MARSTCSRTSCWRCNEPLYGVNGIVQPPSLCLLVTCAGARTTWNQVGFRESSVNSHSRAHVQVCILDNVTTHTMRFGTPKPSEGNSSCTASTEAMASGGPSYTTPYEQTFPRPGLERASWTSIRKTVARICFLALRTTIFLSMV